MTVHQSIVAPGVLGLVIDEPATRNALTAQTIAELAGGLDRLATDDTVRVGVLSAAGEYFCSGGDTRRMGGQRPGPWPRRDHLDRGVGRLARRFLQLDKPVLAAVTGPAIGAGMDLALWCDLRFAAPGAYLRPGFVDLGLVPGSGGAWLLTRLLGSARALEILLTGRPVTAEQALALGLYRSVTDRPLAAAGELAAELAGKPAPAVRATKRLVQQALTSGVREHLELAWCQFGLLQETPEHTAAVESLRESR